MKVALVFDGLGFGGIERVGVSYSKLFLDLGYEVDIYNLKPQCNEMVKEFDARCNIRTFHLPEIILPDRYMLMVKRWWWGKYLYPFVHFGGTCLLYIYRLLMGKRARYDIVVAFSGHFRDLSFVTFNYIKGAKKMCWLHGALADYLLLSCTFGDLYRKIRNLCVLSRANELSALVNHRYLDGLNIRQIYNPLIDRNEMVDMKVVKQLQDLYGEYLLMIGRFDQDKDQKTVIYAMKILTDKYHRKEKLLFVGAGSTLDECKQLVSELGLEQSIVFLGARYDVQNYYSGAKLFIHSSPAEGLPTVLLEAMRYGVPIIATDSPPGVTEILKNSEYGLKCEVGNPSDMAEKVNSLLINEEKRQEYIKKGTIRVSDFSEETIRQELKGILDSLI